MTFAQAQFGNHLTASNAGGARGHPISTAESPPEKPLIHPRLGLSHHQDFQFQNRPRINQLTGRAEQFQGVQPESPEEFWGRRKLPSRGWSRRGRHRPAALDRGGCFLRGAAWGGQCFPPTLPFGGSQPGLTALALRRGASVTQAAQLGWTGDTSRPYLTPPEPAHAGQTGPRFGKGSWKSEVQLHGSTAGAGGAGEGKEEETTACNAHGGGEEVISGTRRTLPSQL